jgi:hypothetical protein
VPPALPQNALETILNNRGGVQQNDSIPQGKEQQRPCMTVQQFALAINDWASIHGHSNASTNDLLRLLRDSIPGINLPLGKSDQTPFSDKLISSNTIKKYIQVDLKSFPTDVCRRECMAFRGHQFIGTDTEPTDCSRYINKMLN